MLNVISEQLGFVNKEGKWKKQCSLQKREFKKELAFAPLPTYFLLPCPYSTVVPEEGKQREERDFR